MSVIPGVVPPEFVFSNLLDPLVPPNEKGWPNPDTVKVPVFLKYVFSGYSGSKRPPSPDEIDHPSPDENDQVSPVEVDHLI